MIAASNPAYQYQVGGSLRINAPSYVERQADHDLYQALLRGEFCYVFNSRQMGKSSLRSRTRYRLQQAGMGCVSIDLARVGSKQITPEQWYLGILVDLVRSLSGLEKIDLVGWWRDRSSFSSVQRFSQFLETVVLPQVTHEKLFIFLDEIDSVLSLDFAVDDFFAFIRSCYNQRAENPLYERLTWALFGVATPTDLIRDPLLTPFNIGRAIDLQGFQLSEVQPLIDGLMDRVSHPQAVLKEILVWTNGQPFLTQKLCQMVADWGRQDEQSRVIEDENYQLDQHLPIAHPHLIQVYYSQSVLVVEKFVRSRLIEQWEIQDQPEHLKTVRDRLLKPQNNLKQRPLELYQAILQGTEVPIDDSPEQLALLLSGVVSRQQGRLQVANRIYQEIFNQQWVNAQLAARKIEITKRPVEPGNCAKSAFIAQISHDLRTPLHSILGFTQRLERDSSLTAAQREQLQIIHQNSEVLLSQINHLLEVLKDEAEFADLQPGTRSPTHTSETLTAVMLANLPLDWVHQLHQAALRTDEQYILHLLELQEMEGAIATTLEEWVKNFRCDKILDLTQAFLQSSHQS